MDQEKASYINAAFNSETAVNEYLEGIPNLIRATEIGDNNLWSYEDAESFLSYLVAQCGAVAYSIGFSVTDLVALSVSFIRPLVQGHVFYTLSTVTLASLISTSLHGLCVNVGLNIRGRTMWTIS